MLDRLRISLKKTPAFEVRRVAIDDTHLVYIMCANKMVKYERGRTPVLYIGTTTRGILRLAESSAKQADDILSRHGITSFNVRIVTCGRRPRVRVWKKLESALLITFYEKYGELPLCNVNGAGSEGASEFRLFRHERVSAILDDLAENGVARGREISN